MDPLMNPHKIFSPNRFDPLYDWTEEYFLSKRDRVEPPRKLPTYWIKPKVIREWQMVWMYESKQDIYLILAHRCNDLQKQIDDLKELLNNK